MYTHIISFLKYYLLELELTCKDLRLQVFAGFTHFEKLENKKKDAENHSRVRLYFNLLMR